MLIAVSSLASTVAIAEDAAYTMTTISDSAYGQQVAAGEFELAIAKLTAADDKSDALFKAVNLCVAYTKTGSFDDATIACDAAIEKTSATKLDRRSSMSIRFQMRAQASYLAISLTNRGVLRAVMGDVELAYKDFMDALETDVNTKVARINLARLGGIAAKTA